jgi:hypothetical protein
MKVLTVDEKWYVNNCSVTENADKQFKQVVERMKLNESFLSRQWVVMLN